MSRSAPKPSARRSKLRLVIESTTDAAVSPARVRLLVRRFAEKRLPGRDVFVTVRLVLPREMRALNKRMRGVDRATDVLSEELHRFTAGPAVLGTVTLCPRVIDDEDGDFAYLLLHGLHHAIGDDHRNRREEARMDARVREILGRPDAKRPRTKKAAHK